MLDQLFFHKFIERTFIIFSQASEPAL